MRAYELMIIFDGDLDEPAVDELLSRVGELVSAQGGTIPTTDRWGKRRFAYEIDHKTEGTYVVLEITTTATDLDEVDRLLRLADDVVRHKILRLPDDEAARRGLLGGETAEPARAGQEA